MFTIQELTERENRLLTRIHGTIGSMDEKTRQYKDSGIFDSYRELHKEYTSLAAIGNIEALKRAVFLQWFAEAEPSCFTGIPGKNPWGDSIGLDADAEKLVLNLAQQSIFSNTSNIELEWMLAWYYQISDDYFAPFWNDAGLTEKLRLINSKRRSLSDIKVFEPLQNRGQMGEYWLSIFSQLPKA